MITLYYWPTPNGHKISIMLEELDCPYRVIPVDILSGAQFAPDFLAISPNNKIPALIDRSGPDSEPIALFESGAILIYLAEKFGRFIGQSGRERAEVLQWLMFQVGGIGPMFGQCGHFLGYAPTPIPYAIDRYRNETLRLYGVMDRRLADREFLAGDYSIADMAAWPWVHVRWLHQIRIDEFPNVKRWSNAIAGRPAVQRGIDLLAAEMKIGNPDPETFEVFFGKSQLTQGRD